MVHILNTKVKKIVQLEVYGFSGTDSGYHLELKIDGDEVQIYPPSRDELEGYMLQWRIVWEGAIDFEGNKKDMLQRYPELKAINGIYI